MATTELPTTIPKKYYGEPQKKYYLNNSVKVKKIMSDYYQLNKEHIKQQRRERYARQKAERLAQLIMPQQKYVIKELI